ncbi:Pyruvate/Phosphoenolpyruvate kinase [Niveomyces insectorum RCEF 264]|uniref:Pyruvate/Phosphoenolpyruvate kinase n=1 Tax=Niveomyces insectorum RCEF 264 TaxID=1081102 RepID=A0A162JBV1_9HYPO|nr:Pyruvate/Phosphoenolpyruvate kinase [Niveomyces insectorum RCEF 264]
MATSTLCENVLYTKAKKGRLVKTFATGLVTNPLVVQYAKNAGFDALWVEMEHSIFTVAEVSALASAGMAVGLTPIVRVPYQCGMGVVQQVLDSGAMAVLFPHICSAAAAADAVAMCKFPPVGKRSLWIQQAAVGLRKLPMGTLADVVNTGASSVAVMIEAAEAIVNVDEIAAVAGVDLLMVGCMDLSTELGIPGQIKHPDFRAALEAVSVATRKHGKVFGVAGAYNDPEFQDWLVNTLGVRLLLVGVDANLIAVGAVESITRVNTIDKTVPN